MTQWQCEFRGQIRALTQWLKNMEMRLPPMESRVSLVLCLNSLLSFLFFQLYILFKHFPTLLSSFLVYTSFKSFGVAAHSWFLSMGHPVVTRQSHSYPIIRAITPSNKITAKFKSTRRWSTWTNESCWCLQTLQLFDHHKKKAMKCASYRKVCHTQPDTEVVLLHPSRRDFFRPQENRGPEGVRLHCLRPGQPGWGSACSGGPSTQMSTHSERTLESEGKKKKKKKKTRSLR